MSGEATGYVWHFSPAEKSALLVHLAIADVVNDMNRNEFWSSVATISEKTRLGRSSVIEALDFLQERGLLTLLKKRPGQTDLYRFECPPLPVQYSDRSLREPVQKPDPPVQDSDGGGPETGPKLNRTQSDNPRARETIELPPFDETGLAHLQAIRAKRFAAGDGRKESP